MSYKGIVENIVKRAAISKAEEIFAENNIKYLWADADSIEMKSQADFYNFTVELRVCTRVVNGGGRFIGMEISGFVDNYGDVACSLAWTKINNMNSIIWVANGTCEQEQADTIDKIRDIA